MQGIQSWLEDSGLAGMQFRRELLGEHWDLLTHKCVRAHTHTHTHLWLKGGSVGAICVLVNICLVVVVLHIRHATENINQIKLKSVSHCA